MKIPLRDGVELMGDIFRPKSDQKFPAILQQTPNGKTGQAARAKKFAARGYVVVNTDSRGRFESGGEWDPFSSTHKTNGYQPYEYTIEFWRPTGNVFAAGHRIRIEISSSYFPYYLPNPNSAEDNIGLVKEFQTARQTIYHDAGRPSHVVLPVIPAGR